MPATVTSITPRRTSGQGRPPQSVSRRPFRDNPRLILAGIGVGLVAVASTLARRRIPERASDQSPDTFWANADATGGAIVLWALIEGAGLVGWVGYLLTGVTAAAVAAVIAIGALVVFRPSRLEGPKESP